MAAGPGKTNAYDYLIKLLLIGDSGMYTYSAIFLSVFFVLHSKRVK